jgi:hypothetical protein
MCRPARGFRGRLLRLAGLSALVLRVMSRAVGVHGQPRHEDRVAQIATRTRDRSALASRVMAGRLAANPS